MKKLCKICIMQEGYQGTILNAKGICNHCEEYFKFKDILCDFPRLGSEFQRLIDQHRVGHKYDCMVLFSGGKDSSYVLYKLSTELNLNVLAFTYDWGLQDQVAYHNCRNTVDKLGIEHITFSPDQTFLKEMRRQFVINRGIGEFCRPCMKQIMATSFRFAQELDVPIIVQGLSRSQALCEIVGIYWFKNLIEKLGQLTKQDLITHFSGHLVYEELLRITLSEDIFAKARYQIDETKLMPILLPYFAFYPYDEKEIRKTITDKLGWIEPSFGRDLLGHTDCRVGQAAEYFYPKTYVVSRRMRELSYLVRSGSICRDEALELEKKSTLMPEPYEQTELILEYLHLTAEEKEKAFACKTNSHFNFSCDFSSINMLSD